MVGVSPQTDNVIDDDGRQTRKRLPQCIEHTIRLIRPEQDVLYTGFKASSYRAI